MPEQDASMRFFTPVGTAATGDFVAVLAQAARLYAPYDQKASDDYLAAARRGYAFLAANAGPPVPDTSTTFTTGGYGQRSDASNRLWAAAELWETTGEAPFLADFEAGIGATPTVDFNFDWDNVRNLGLFTYLLSKRDGRDPTRDRGAHDRGHDGRRRPGGRTRGRRRSGAASPATGGDPTARSRAAR